MRFLYIYDILNKECEAIIFWNTDLIILITKVPQMVIENDFTIQGKHNGTIHVENGTLTIQGELYGTLDVQTGAKAIIIGKQHGTVSVENNAEVIIVGELHGTTNVCNYGTVIIEKHGKLAGTLSNNGVVIVRGVFGGAQSGNGELILEGNGYIKQATIKDEINYYEW